MELMLIITMRVLFKYIYTVSLENTVGKFSRQLSVGLMHHLLFLSVQGPLFCFTIFLVSTVLEG